MFEILKVHKVTCLKIAGYAVLILIIIADLVFLCKSIWIAFMLGVLAYGCLIQIGEKIELVRTHYLIMSLGPEEYCKRIIERVK